MDEELGFSSIPPGDTLMSAGAAAAAAVAAEMQRQEEEEMTPYSPRDLAEDWEFKILRSNFATFRNPAKLRAALDEEQRGGWVLVEKFDDRRIRLKRPAGTKAIQGDFADQYDPYRTTIGMSPGALAATTLGFAVLVMFGLLTFVSRLCRKSGWNWLRRVTFVSRLCRKSGWNRLRRVDSLS